MGFRLNLKWGGLSVQSPLSTSSSSLPSSYSCRGRDNSYFLARLTATSVLYGEAETLNDASRVQVSSSTHQILEKNFLETRDLKGVLGKDSGDGLVNNDDKLRYLTSLQASHYRLLMKTLDILEDMFADSHAVRLESDILEQLERLGAVRLFHSCLSRILKSSNSLDLSNVPTQIVEESGVDESKDNHMGKVVVRSGKKEVRKLRRKRTLKKEAGASLQELLSETFSKVPEQPNLRPRNKRRKITRNEAEMASGVKLIAELEKLEMLLEKETGQTPSLSSWAEAAGVEKKELQHRLHYGWHCRDELLRSTRSLVLFIARNYWGLGVAFEDLIQAGDLGVLQGAERFDQSRGYKFSTYVHYWIRKSISTLVARHARGVRIPSTLTKVINQVQKARKALSISNGKYPDDCEIAKFTGLSIAKITLASKCLRVVGSIDQKIGGSNTKYMEITPDTSMLTPEDAIFRQHMKEDIYTLLNGLEPREKQVMILRFGLGNRECRSLEEIGRRFCVSKEWIRRIERAALAKLRSEDSLEFLSHYIYMQ